ncbi:FUSC family protein [Paraburkholderia terricola]|uniref:Membrane protein YccC n=1 Tax=Paraburkholderia terricola TaxID=169427 RepID=A0ABU1LVD5_9BURK|nr:FUSC family membrane protein [Paraburkholderia terricola]MDR6410475.1 putative membrane protein YccC [Paraburkholderia terricola]MDR6484737.1 putative membrane protein YccC [Paraburkholderia terricola]
MRYSVEIKKFLYSQYFYGGLRIAVGVSLPAVLCLVVFNNRELGFTIATGALGACVVDMPGPLKYKHNEMLACSVIGFLAALATGLATVNSVALWCTVVPLTFVLSLIVVYGNRWPQISFATLFMMILTLEERFTPIQALVNASWILVGGLWYTYWSTFVSRWMMHRIEQQALAESVFACADYLLARAAFYDLDNDLDECYRNLVDKQIAAVERQDAARDMVLRNLPRLKSGKLEPRRAMLFNLFINTVDLHELFVGTHTDYPLVRNTFGGSDLLVFYRDLIRKAAADLEEIGLAVLQNQAPRMRVNVKAELRAIEFEIELMRKQDLPAKNPEAYSAVSSTFRRIWSATRLIDKMRKSLSGDPSATETELRLDQALSRFVSSRRVPFGQIFSNLTMASPSFRHALRVTIAVAVGFWLGRLLPLTNAYWIVMTTVIILKPGYSLTKQRNGQRIVGTLIGCTASIALIIFVKEPHILLVVMFASMVMSYSLLLFNYAASVVFTSSYVLLMFHLLAPGSMRIIGERAIDTVVGCAIAIAASHLFPYWEYRLMGKLVNNMIGATRQYLEASWWWSGKPAAAVVATVTEAGARAPAAAMADPAIDIPRPALAAANGGVDVGTSRGASGGTGSGTNSGPGAETNANAIAHAGAAAVASAPAKPPATGASPAAAAAATALDRDYRYRLARKNVHVAFANLGQAFQRMMLEPKSAQKFVPELNDLLVRSHVLASQITVVAPLLRTSAQQNDGVSLQPLQRALSVVRDNLTEAEAGTALPADQGEQIKLLNRELDAMVVETEKSPDYPADAVNDMKLLAHQCKQMLSASAQIRKDASVIRLPEG